MALVLLEGKLAHSFGLAAIVFAGAALTDFLDGYLARRFRITTVLGSFLDTTADKLLVTGALLALVAVGRASPWVTFIIVAREIVVMALRGLAAVDRIVLHSSVWGKLKANLQFLAIFMAMLRFPPRLGPLYTDEWVMWLAAAITIASGAEYLVRIWPALRSPEQVEGGLR